MMHLNHLVCSSNAELSALDIAAVNLACAAGLPGAERLDVEHCLDVLDGWAEHVRRETARCAGQFERDPAVFENSRAYFRVLVMLTVLQEDCGVRYNSDLVHRDDFFVDAANLFIHGVIAGKDGTCSSLPPVYVAVGRRLGYPLKLVQTSAHLFARWDEPETKERFNIECTSRGLNCHSDEYYRQWPVPTTPEVVAECGFLKSLTPREELAMFLATRGHCLLENRRYRAATEAYAWACSLAAGHGGYENCVLVTLDRWRGALEQLVPPHFPRLTIHLPPRRFLELRLELEQEIVRLEVIESLIESGVQNQHWWEALRCSPDERPAYMPTHITVHDPSVLRQEEQWRKEQKELGRNMPLPEAPLLPTKPAGGRE